MVVVCVKFYYGEDGLDVTKTSFIKCSRPSDKFPPFSFLIGNRSVIVSEDDLSQVKKKTDVEAAPRLNRKVVDGSENSDLCSLSCCDKLKQCEISHYFFYVFKQFNFVL